MRLYEFIFRDEHADFGPEYGIAEVEASSIQTAVRSFLPEILAQARAALPWVGSLTDEELAGMIHVRAATVDRLESVRYYL